MVLSLTTVGAAAPALADPNDERLTGSLRQLNDLLDRWAEVTIDCMYAEVPRELLETKNKQALLEQATKNALFDKSASIQVCKSTDRAVRQALGGDGPLSRIDKLLGSPEILDGVAQGSEDRVVALSEQLQQALSAADAAAYMSETGDYSARTPFKQGESASSPNLNAARSNIVEARDTLCALIQLRSTP